MYCEICDAEITVIIGRYRTEPFLDGKKHENICMCCVSFAQLYFSNTTYGILTGLLADPEGIKDYGFNDVEIARSEAALKRLTHDTIVSKVREPIILNTIILPPIAFLDLGVRHLDLSSDSDVLIESN